MNERDIIADDGASLHASGAFYARQLQKSGRTDSERLNWLEKTQACVTHANHRFYVAIHSAPDPENVDSLRDRIDQQMEHHARTS